MKTHKPSKRLRWWDLPAALLLLAALYTTALRLTATEWTNHLSMMQTLTVLGLIAGLALGQSKFSRSSVLLIGLIFGLFFVSRQLGLTMSSDIQWSERLVSIGGRIFTTASQVIQREIVYDPILFLFLMALLFWTISSHAGYSLTRHAHPWSSTLPAGLALFTIHIYDPFWPYRTWYLIAYIFFALLLLARLTFLRKRDAWQATNTRLPPYLGLDLIRITLVATAVMLLLAWTVPALASSVPLADRAWDRLTRPWIEARSRLSTAFASLRASVGLVTDYYGETLPLGRGNALTDSLVLTVTAPESPAGVRYYWRTRVYDTYDTGWSSGVEGTISLSPQRFDIQYPELEGRWDANFKFTTNAPIATLFAVPQPRWVSRPVRANLEYFEDGTADLISLQSVEYLRAGETYEVRSSLAATTIADLRAAGSLYPEEIRERYLQLPDDITPRTRELARQITAGLETNYDKVVAITDYLRNNIRYNDTVPSWPADQEPVDWILFDHRQAFCNYYATSEIVLLRSIGIPARLAVGYAEGEWVQETSQYRVRQRDAHAWPEVYFPRIGWVEFEPTVNQFPIIRPSGIDPNDPALSDPAPDPTDPLLNDRFNNPNPEGQLQDQAAGDEGARLFQTLILAALGLAVLGAAFLAFRSRRFNQIIPTIPLRLEAGFKRIGLPAPRSLLRWVYLANLSPTERAYLELNKALSRMGMQPQPHETPAERATTLSILIPALATPSQDLLYEYHSLVYSQQRSEFQKSPQAARMIRRLSWIAWFKRLLTQPRKRSRSDLPFIKDS